MMAPFPCPAILSFPALLQLRQLAACLVIWGLSERVPATVPLCASHCATVPKPLRHCASQCPLPLRHTPAAKCLTVCHPASQNQGVTAIYHIHPPMHTYTLIPHIDNSDKLLLTLVTIDKKVTGLYHIYHMHVAHNKEVHNLQYTFHCMLLLYYTLHLRFSSPA